MSFFPMVRLSPMGPTFAQLPVMPMQIPSFGIRPAIAAIAGFLALSASSPAQQLFPSAVKPATAPQSRPAPVPSSRAASCHNGASFEKFLSELKQRALGEGVSQRAILEASPYLVYNQGIVNRDRGQRVFGQIFTEFAGRMA